MNGNGIFGRRVAGIVWFATIGVLCAGGFAACRSNRPPPRGSAGFAVLRTIPAFLDPAPVRDIGVDTAYFSYGPATIPGPRLVLEESREIKFDREPTNPIRWVGPPPETTVHLVYESVFNCADLVIRASVIFPTLDAAKSATAQLDIVAAELSARCAELAPPSARSVR